MDYFSWKKLIDALVLNFKAMFPALVKVTKKDLCKVLTGKQYSLKSHIKNRADHS